MTNSLPLFFLLLVFTSDLLFAEGPNEGWNHSSEAGIALVGGNSSSETIHLKQETKYGWEKNLLKLNGHYLLGKSSGIESAKNWSAGLRYERTLSEQFSAFVGNSWNGDKFAGFDYRANIDAGGKYLFINTDKANYLFSETGYRFTYEKRIPLVTPNSDSQHIIRLYFEGGKALSESITAKLWVELLPDISDTKNFAYNFEPSLNVSVSSHLALKLAFLGRYDALPAIAGNKKFDSLYTTSLLANF